MGKKSASALRSLRKTEKALVSVEERIERLQQELEDAFEEKQKLATAVSDFKNLLVDMRALEEPDGFYLFVKGMCTESCRRMPFSQEVKSLDRALKQGVPEGCYEASLVVVFNKKGKRDKVIARQSTKNIDLQDKTAGKKIRQWEITAAGKKTIKELSL